MVFIPFCLSAQIDMPPSSPDATWVHQLGFTQIDLSYSRPQMRGRKIFGNLVPYNELWRTGAGESTRINFNDDIFFAGQKVKKGKYAIYSIPNPKEWTIILNSDATLHGDFGYDETKDVLRVKIKPERSAEKSESFVIDLIDFQPDFSAVLQMKWDNTLIKIPVKSLTEDKILAQIEETLIRNKSENAGLLLKGAQFYYQLGKDKLQALEWAKKADSITTGNFSNVFLMAMISGDLNKYEEAIKSAEKAIQIGKKQNKTEEVMRLEEKITSWRTSLDSGNK